jgi:hypothetical protein
VSRLFCIDDPPLQISESIQGMSLWLLKFESGGSSLLVVNEW